MDEQENNLSEEQVPKTPSTIKSVFRWLFVGVLAVLLIAAVIFHAPWKVIALLVVFLLACTALPKPFRKWFWLSVGVVVIVLIVWVFLPENNEGWQPYTFDEELAALEAKYAIPDSENAAMIYNQLLDSYDANAFEPKFMDSNLDELITRRGPWSSKDHPEVAQWLRSHENTIAGLLEASKIEKCRFPIPVPADPVGLHRAMKRLASMRCWAILLNRAANNDLGDNRIESGLEKCFAILQLGNHISRRQPFIYTVTGIVIESLATTALRRFTVAGHPTEEHLTTIEKALAAKEHNWSVDLPRILEYEKLFCKNWVGRFYEIAPRSNKIRLSRDPLADWRTAWEENIKDQQQIRQRRQLLQVYIYPNYWEKKIIRAHTLLRWLFLPSNPEKAGKIIDTIFEKHYAMAKPDFDWKKQPKKPLILLATPSESVWPSFNQRQAVERLAAYVSERRYHYHRLHDLYLHHLSSQKGCQILIALRRYKNENAVWPKSLADIKVMTAPETFVDPINDGSFVYKLTEDGFTLYSKGKNNIDEGGERDRKSGADDWPVWPPRHRKTKKENDDAE